MKKSEDVTKLLDEINKVLGDTSKTAEIFYLLKKQGSVSAKQKEEIIKLEQQIVENQHQVREHTQKFIQLLQILKQQGEISGRQQTALIELSKKVIDSQKATKEILLSLTDIARTLKVVLPKTFDVIVKNTNDFPNEFRISNIDEIPSPPDEVHIKKPLWLPDFFEAAFKFVTQPIINALKKQLQNVNITGPTDPSKAIAVRLSDGKRFYTAIIQAIAGATNTQKVEELLQQIADGDKWQRNTLLGKAYVVTTNAITISGTSEVAFLLLKNPASSGRVIRIKKILFGLENTTSLSTYRIYREPSITINGTALTPVNLQKGGPVSILAAFRSPTVSANGILMIADNFTSHNPDHDPDLGLLIQQNENILLTVDPATNNMAHMVTIYYLEE